MANAVMQAGRTNGTRGENYDYAFKVRNITLGHSSFHTKNSLPINFEL